MEQLAYQRTKPRHGILGLLLFVGIVAQVGVIFLVNGSPFWSKWFGGWLVPLAVLPLLAAVLIGWRILVVRNRERVQQLAVICDDLGFRLLIKPTQSEKTAYYAPLAHLADVLMQDKGAERVEWIAEPTSAEKSERLFEHSFTRGTGKNVKVFTHTVLAWPAKHSAVRRTPLGSLASFWVEHESPDLRWTLQKLPRVVPSSGELAKEWSVYGDSDAALQFLVPGVRQELNRAPKLEWWYVGNGWVCCVFADELHDANLSGFVRHARSVLAAAGSA